jgi:hypothetical protein
MVMQRIIIRGSWSDCVGTDYCDALGWYPIVEGGAVHPSAWQDAKDYAWDRWEPQETSEDWDDEGPDYCVEVYNPDEHDMLRAGGGSFIEDFEKMR